MTAMVVSPRPVLVHSRELLPKPEIEGLLVEFRNPNMFWMHVHLYQAVNEGDGWKEVYSNESVVVPPGGSRLFEVPENGDYRSELTADYGEFCDPPVYDEVLV